MGALIFYDTIKTGDENPKWGVRLPELGRRKYAGLLVWAKARLCGGAKRRQSLLSYHKKQKHSFMGCFCFCASRTCNRLLAITERGVLKHLFCGLLRTCGLRPLAMTNEYSMFNWIGDSATCNRLLAIKWRWSMLTCLTLGCGEVLEWFLTTVFCLFGEHFFKRGHFVSFYQSKCHGFFCFRHLFESHATLFFFFNPLLGNF